MTDDIRPDQSLVTAALEGDPSAFDQLVRRYERAARATCVAVLGDQHLAFDAAQDAFVIAYRTLGHLRDKNAFGGWLTTIARNRAVRMARHRRADAPLPPSIAAATDNPADDALLGLIAALPDHERAVVLLRYFENHDVQAIAAMLGRPVGTVTKQLSRAHDRLRRALWRKEHP